MKRKGILKHLVISTLFYSSCIFSAHAAEADSVDDIAAMLTWWDELGSDWEEAKEFIELTAVNEETPYVLAENTVETLQDEQQQ